MINFLKTFLFFFILLEISEIFLFLSENDFPVHNLFLIFSILLLLFNFYFNIIVSTKLDTDLFFKYLYLLFKTPNFFLNFIINTLKKVYLFLVHFKYKYIISTNYLIYKKYIKNIFIVWRPLFKKISYFGYYRSNRSKWIK